MNFHDKFASLLGNIQDKLNMLYPDVFGTISSEFCGISWIYMKFVALQSHKISEALLYWDPPGVFTYCAHIFHMSNVKTQWMFLK